jgi:hypothetical protein
MLLDLFDSVQDRQFLIIIYCLTASIFLYCIFTLYGVYKSYKTYQTYEPFIANVSSTFEVIQQSLPTIQSSLDIVSTNLPQLQNALSAVNQLTPYLPQLQDFIANSGTLSANIQTIATAAAKINRYSF